MPVTKLIALKTFCLQHDIPADFILELHQHEIIQLVVEKRSRFIPIKQLQELERIIRIYRDLQLDINGIQTVLHLVNRLQEKDAEINALRNQLNFYRSTQQA
jgi:hypothetical protein